MIKIITKDKIKEHQKFKDNMLIVDLLPEESYEEHNVPCSINIPYEENDSFVVDVREKVLTQDRKIILYCRNKDCEISKEAAEELEKANFTDIEIYKNGIDDWYGESTEEVA